MVFLVARGYCCARNRWCRGAAEARAQGQKIAVVNSRILSAERTGRPERQAMLKREGDVFEAQMTSHVRFAQVDGQGAQGGGGIAQSVGLGTRDRRRSTTFWRSSREQSDSIRSVAERRQGDVLQPVIDQVNKVLQDIRTEDGYAVVLDIGADATPIVAYDKNLDITDRVLERIKKLPAIPMPAIAHQAGRGDGQAAPAATGAVSRMAGPPRPAGVPALTAAEIAALIGGTLAGRG